MSARAALILCTLLPVAVASCRPRAATAPPPPTGDVYRVALGISPDAPPRQLVSTEFRAKVETADGIPVKGAVVTADFTMPAMPMPPLRPRLEPGGAGDYRCRTMFTMEGEWQIAVQVAMPGAPPETHYFRYLVK